MTATYPNDASLDINNFSVISTATYNNTGGSEYSFQLSQPVSTVAEVWATIDGVTQPTSTYQMDAYNGTKYANVAFLSPPDATILSLKTLAIPTNFLVRRQALRNLLVEYGNTFVTSVHGNNYVVDGIISTFALPPLSTTTDRDSIVVSVSGVIQNANDYVYPSSTLSYSGIDIIETPSNVDSIAIRVIDPGSQIYDRRTSIADRKVDRGYSYTKDIPVKTVTYMVPYEKRRLLSRKFMRSWDLTYTNITGAEKDAIQNFYDARSGNFEAFIFELDHLNELGSALVRFDGSPSFQHVMSAEPGDLYRNIWTVNMKLKEVDD